MPRVAVLIEPGTVYGKLTAIGVGERHVRKNGYTDATTECRCACGGSRTVRNAQLRGGDVTSCGCQFQDRQGDSNSPEYFAWKSMISRCFNPKTSNYALYGGRGITVCARWKTSYAAFLQDVGRKPSPDYSLDRIDTNGNYAPVNVKWSTGIEQQNNRRCNRLISWSGQVRTVAQWAVALSLPRNTILTRLDINGWSIDDAFTTPVDRKNKRLLQYRRAPKS